MPQQSLSVYFSLELCELGYVLVAAHDAGICAISLGDDPQLLKQQLQADFADRQLRENPAAVTQQMQQVIALLTTPEQQCDLPLAPEGTPFQQKVWQALQHIPVGQTLSYRQLAEQIGSAKASRAVAAACAANKIAVAIPCHRVIGSDGKLAGYRWGLERKRWLLEREALLQQA